MSDDESTTKANRKAAKKVSDECINEFAIKLDRHLNPQEFIELDRRILDEKESKGVMDISTDSSPYIPLAEKYVYHPGDLVTGTIQLDLYKDLPAVNIQVSFKGKMSMTYEVYKNKSKRTMKMTDDLEVEPFSTTIWQIQEEKRHAAARRPALQLGRHMYTFQHVIPFNVLGTVSYESSRSGDEKSAGTRYFYQSTITLENGLTLHCEQPVAIQRRLVFSPDLGVSLDSPQVSNINKQFSSCYGGEFTAEVKLHPGYFITDGQTAMLDLYISNTSRKTLRKVKCMLYQQADFVLSFGTDCSLNKVVAETKFHPDIKPSMSLSINNIRLPIPHGTEPSLVDSTTQTGPYNLSYYVRVEFFTSRYGSCDLWCQFEPYLIGSSSQLSPPSPPPNYDDDAETIVGHHATVLSARQLVVNAAFQRASTRYDPNDEEIDYNDDTIQFYG